MLEADVGRPYRVRILFLGDSKRRSTQKYYFTSFSPNFLEGQKKQKKKVVMKGRGSRRY
jgi:hypothetical protein